MKQLVMLVGPPGSGKSTLAKKYEDQGLVRISQDDQGKSGHLDLFLQSLNDGHSIVVDRMNFNVQQRSNYILMAKKAGYTTTIVVIHESYATCLERALKRAENEGHPTIKDEKNARSALQVFFTKYERPKNEEADLVTFIYPEGPKPKVIVCDLDGTLCDVEHRRHHVRGTDEKSSTINPDGSISITVKPFKKDWAAFFRDIPKDPANQWCLDILAKFNASGTRIVFCSGRDDNQRKMTVEWLDKHCGFMYTLYMRNRQDSRQDSIVKEIILDFELLTRYTPYFMIDDRDQVVEMWRKRGFTCLQCADGDF